MTTRPELPLAPWSPPAEFDEYRLVSRLGRGAMGEVFVALDIRLDRQVAIKFIKGLADPIARGRFLTEARAVARLQDPHVVTIHRIGETDGRPYIVSELVRGETLDKLARPVPWRRVLDIAIDLARGLAAAHKSGVLHRDIKPSNAIFGEDGRTKLLDFGLAKLIVEGIEFAETGERHTVDVTELANRLAARSDDVEVSATIPAHSGSAARGAMTMEGTLVGTPLYMAPERWSGLPATQSSDLYSLGAVIYELVADVPPHEGPTAAVIGVRAISSDAPPVRSRVRDIDPRLAAAIDRCVARDPEDRFVSADALAAALEEIALGRPALADDGNPYRGLYAFEPEHRGVFFGRDGEARTVVERLKVEGLVVVAGDSGVGKSSLCRAGVLPAVQDGALGEGWSVISLVPGLRPMTALDHAIARAAGDQAIGVRESADDLASDLRRLAGRRACLLFVDQLEELVTIAAAGEAAQFADFVGQIASTPLPGLRLLASVRSDFLTRVSSLSGLRTVLSRSLFLLPPLSREGLRDAIVGPAGLRGFSFEEGTALALIAPITSPASLPLLQFTLAELWEARDPERRIIARRALEELGGVEGALARHGDKVIASLLPAQRPIARSLLTLLVTADGTRARRTAAELVGSTGERREVLEALVHGRLVAAEESDGEPSYQLIHEALISVWQTLADWLDDDSALLVRRERLRVASAEWDRLGRGRDLLWAEPQLREVAGLADEELDEVSRAFLARSRRAVRVRRRLRQGVVVLVLAAVAATWGVVQLQAARRRDHEVDSRLTRARALLGEVRADNREVEAERRRALAEFDRGRTAEGEALWKRSREAAVEVDRKYIDAISLLDQALVFDPGGARVRGVLASALYDRILLAERDELERQRGELVVRLGDVDPAGRWKDKLTAPAQVSLAIRPLDAEVTVERYLPDRRRRLIATPVRRGALAGAGALPLPAGSYRVVARAPGRAEVKLPFTVARGESLELAFELPPAAAIPPGLVYVPPGRFLAGSGADDELRSLFFSSPPRHPVDTGAYLIARHETTFAEWIEFLEDLPAEERARRTPRAGPWGIVALTRVGPRRYQLAFTAGKESYRAESGERLVYRGRDRRDAQDWLRFPAAGISADDVLAYLGWLDRTGRLAGARMCSEREWERAARGADRRGYPHGDALEPDDANYLATYGEAHAGPDEVGSHPDSESPYGVADMVGNVFELTRGMTGGTVVARGGAFIYDPVVNRIDNRVPAEPGFLGLYVGFRVCAPAPSR